MATAVLRPRDCLTERIGVSPATSFSRRKAHGYYPNPTSTCKYYNNSFVYPNPNPSPRSSRRSAKKPSSDDIGVARSTSEKVTILRRGESLDSKIKSDDAMAVYAGSAFVVSPSPSDLPLPSFSIKVQAFSSSDSVDDSATRDLRRLLRIG